MPSSPRLGLLGIIVLALQLQLLLPSLQLLLLLGV
jgi:hypothetical protein